MAPSNTGHGVGPGPKQIIPEPSRFRYFSSQMQSTESSDTWEGLLSSPAVDLPLSEERRQPDGDAWWLDVYDATEEDVNTVSDAFNIHPLTTEDVALREKREKVEVFRTYYFISFRVLVSDAMAEGYPSSAEFYILVFYNGTITFSPRGSVHVDRVGARIRKMQDPTVLSSDWICYALIDDIVDSFEPFMRAASLEAEAIEDQVFIARVDDAKVLIPRVDNLRKKITHLIHCLNGKGDVLNGFVKRCKAKDKHPVFPDGDLLMYLGDVQDHLVTTMSNLSHFDEIVGRSQANCLAHLSATNLRMSLNINKVISKVSVLATIFVPMHLVTALWGMNVEVPGQETHGVAWFFGILGVLLAFMVFFVFVSGRLKFL